MTLSDIHAVAREILDKKQRTVGVLLPTPEAEESEDAGGADLALTAGAPA